jgi:hypothetical protein
MKIKWLCTFWFLLLILNSFSQIRILNQSLIYPDSAVLYVCVDNRLVIEGLDSTKQYAIKLTNGSVSKNEFSKFNEYILQVGIFNSLDTISVAYKNKTLFSKIFRIEKIGEQIAMLDSFQIKIISKAELKKCKSLRVCIPNCISIANQRMTVFSYQIYFDCKTCDEIPVLENKNGELNKNIYKYIDYLKSGDKIYFENIKYSPSGCFRKIDIAYTIK